MGKQIMNLISGNVYYYPDCAAFISEIKSFTNFTLVGRKTEYYNIPAAFDIEVSNFYDNDEKRAIMYVWQFGISGVTIIGRTWSQFLDLVNYIHISLKLNRFRRLRVYVHNLSYEFAFLSGWLLPLRRNVFALDRRKVVRFLDNSGIEFCCSYLLSGFGLESVGKNLLTYKVYKLSGALDYNLLRTPATQLTKQEIMYCVNDVRVVMAYVQERIEEDGSIKSIPLTKTSYVRRHMKDKCLYSYTKDRRKAYFHYHNFIKGLTLEPQEYLQLKQAFAGGFTHANYRYANRIEYDVTSIDFTSSYPAVMVLKQFPMSKSTYIGTVKTTEELFSYLDKYCCLFNIRINKIRPKPRITSFGRLYIEDNPISLSRCWDYDEKNVPRSERVHSRLNTLNNGRVISYEYICLTMTELDFITFMNYYEFDSYEITELRVYHKDYLPRELILAILDEYETKTKLKDVEGYEIEYNKSKNNINSCYGMIVTDIWRAINEWDANFGGWLDKTHNDLYESMDDYNEKWDRVLFYPWGVWVTAWARFNLFSGIKEFGDDYRYSDTDSIKAVNYSSHINYVEAYNQAIMRDIEASAKRNLIPIEKFAPKTIKGVSKPMGVWDFDGDYLYFKTIGAKRYLYVTRSKNNTPDKIVLTVAGMNKKQSLKYLCKISNIEYREDGFSQLHYISGDIDHLFDNFSADLYIPADQSGKLTHTYLDEPYSGIVIDYQGTPYEYYEKSGVHLEAQEYSLTITQEYADLISGRHEVQL